MNSHPPNAPQNSPDEDLRVKVTKTIWGCSVGMLGICIPLVGITQSAVIPLCVIAGATLSTIAIWSGRIFQNPANPGKKLDAATVTPEQLRALEERLANVEVISSFERGLSERTAAQNPAIAEKAASPSANASASHEAHNELRPEVRN